MIVSFSNCLIPFLTIYCLDFLRASNFLEIDFLPLSLYSELRALQSAFEASPRGLGLLADDPLTDDHGYQSIAPLLFILFDPVINLGIGNLILFYCRPIIFIMSQGKMDNFKPFVKSRLFRFRSGRTSVYID